MPDLARQRLRSRIEAAVLDAGAKTQHAAHGPAKAAAIGAMRGTVVELGPGTGVNMRYYAPGVKVIGIEPNPHMHERLRAKADHHGVDLEIRTLRGEAIDVADAEADGVVGTLVLCGVDSPHQVVSEAKRVLRPGGTYFFLEHVVAPEPGLTLKAQRALCRPHRWMFNGCEVTRDTATVLRAAGFASVEIDAIDVGPKGGYIRHFILGTAIR